MNPAPHQREDREQSGRGEEPLSPDDYARLWRLARRLQECETVDEAEAVAGEAEAAGRSGPPALGRAIAETIGPALTGIRERERLRGLVIRDPLTGLHNRRFMEDELARQIGCVAGLGQPLAVAMLDLDGFRDYNARHGHPAGDLVLQMLGLLLDGFRGGGDVPCRYGGEEFVLIMPGTTAAAAVARLEPLCARLAARGPDRLPPITASIGVAAFPGHGKTVAALLEAADEAMYRAKRAGRNRVCLAGDGADSRPPG